MDVLFSTAITSTISCMFWGKDHIGFEYPFLSLNRLMITILMRKYSACVTGWRPCSHMVHCLSIFISWRFILVLWRQLHFVIQAFLELTV